MTEEQYNSLCEACDRLLLAPDSSKEVIATPWLHIIRPHPIFFENYKEIFEPEKGKNLKRFVRNIFSALRHLSKACISGGKLWSCVRELPQKSDLLIVSHLLNSDFPNQESDFYYGNVAEKLQEHGFSVTVALINYTEKAPFNLARSWRKAKVPRLIFAPVLSFSAELAIYRRAFVETFRLIGVAIKQKDSLNRRVITRASLEVASGGAVAALRLGEQITALVERLQPSTIMVTYEGHSWERVAFAAARAVSSKIRCIGYQHATLFKLQHAVQRSLADKYNPDVILTSGFVAQARLKKKLQLRTVKIDVLGSNRSFVRNSAKGWQSPIDENYTCLVLPEGNLSECNLLFSFALQSAKRMPHINFIWRLHPSVNYKALTQQSPVFLELPPNVILSNSSLSEDITLSRLALYRGSTSIVQAVVSGVQPVYLHLTGEILIDTLYEVAALRDQVVNTNEFIKLVMQVKTTDDTVNAEQLKDYCASMLTPININLLTKFLTEIC